MNLDNSEKVSKLIESDSHPDFIVLKKDIENEKIINRDRSSKRLY